VEGVPKAILDHAVNELQIAHFGSSAHVSYMGRQRHRLLTARNDGVGITAADMQHGQRHRAQPRTADLVDAESSLVSRNARVHRRLARRVLTLARSEDLAEDDLVDLLRGYLGAA